MASEIKLTWKSKTTKQEVNILSILNWTIASEKKFDKVFTKINSFYYNWLDIQNHINTHYYVCLTWFNTTIQLFSMKSWH